MILRNPKCWRVLFRPFRAYSMSSVLDTGLHPVLIYAALSGLGRGLYRNEVYKVGDPLIFLGCSFYAAMLFTLRKSARSAGNNSTIAPPSPTLPSLPPTTTPERT